MDQHLLGGTQPIVGRRETVGGGPQTVGGSVVPVHGVEQVQPLGVASQHLGGHPQRLAQRRLPAVADVGLDRVVRVPAGPVVLVDAHIAEQGVGGPSEHGQERRLGHVAVVVHPVGLHLSPVQLQRGGHRVARRPGSGRGGRVGGQDAGLPLGHQAAGADAARPQRPHHRQQAVVPLPLQLRDGPPASLVLAARGHGLDQVIGELGRFQAGPRQLQRGPELAQHVAHPALASGQVEGEVGAHGRPAQTGAVDDRVVELGRGGDAAVHHVQVLAPQRFLQAVRQVALDLVAYQQRVHHQVVVVGHGRGDGLRGGGLARHYLH